MRLGIPREITENERRVALIPQQIKHLNDIGLDVVVQAGAGTAAGYSDDVYREKGAQIEESREKIQGDSDVILMISPASLSDFQPGQWREGQLLAGLLNPMGQVEQMRQLAEAGVSACALELVPRLGRSQSMDALSAMALVAGYKAVITAAERLRKIFPMMITAAGTILPARVFVIGAGVAGLEAIGTAHRLGARVSAYDVRAATKDQVESLGADFLELDLDSGDSEESSGYAKEMDQNFLDKQREMMTRAIAKSDVVISTAAVPGKKAPLLITEEMVRGMRPGSVIVDLAAPSGGNCALTRVDEEVLDNGVLILGPSNLPGTVPQHASQLFSGTITSFLKFVTNDGQVKLDLNDPVIAGLLVTHQGKLVHPAFQKETSA